MASKLTLWEKIKMDFKERFLNFETAKGIYLMPAGLITVATTLYYQQHLLTVLGVLFGWYMFSEGLRKVWVNRYKQERKQEEIRQARTEATGVADNIPNVGAVQEGVAQILSK